MEPILTANCMARLAGGVNSGLKPRAMSARAADREQLRRHRAARGQLSVIDRMQADAGAKQAFVSVAMLRKDNQRCRELDAIVDRQVRPMSQPAGPRIVKHKVANLYEGHDKPLEWAPLEYY